MTDPHTMEAGALRTSASSGGLDQPTLAEPSGVPRLRRSSFVSRAPVHEVDDVWAGTTPTLRTRPRRSPCPPSPPSLTGTLELHMTLVGEFPPLPNTNRRS